MAMKKSFKKSRPSARSDSQCHGADDQVLPQNHPDKLTPRQSEQREQTEFLHPRADKRGAGIQQKQQREHRDNNR